MEICFAYVPLAHKAILDVVVNLQFSLIEKLWQTFWRYCPSNSIEGITMTENRCVAFHYYRPCTGGSIFFFFFFFFKRAI